MSLSQTDLDTIEAAIVKGERVVQYADRRVEYRSVAEMIAAASYARAQIKAAAGVSRTTLVSFARD